MRLHGHTRNPALSPASDGQAAAAPAYYPYHRPTRPPAHAAPAFACDAQIHVFGPPTRYKVRTGAAYEAPDAVFAEAQAMHQALGITRAVIVQPTTYGTDHAALLDALALGGPNYRGCAVIDDKVSDAMLLRLHEAGVRGARFNFFSPLNAAPGAASFSRSISRIAELGWYAKLNLNPGWLADNAALLRHENQRWVIDHFGRPDFAAGANSAYVHDVTRALQQGNVWVMLSNAHKLSKAEFPWDDALPIARAYLDAAPERVIWGSDWPHPLSTRPVPDDADLLELVFRMAPDAEERQRILVENPAALFGFGETGGSHTNRL